MKKYLYVALVALASATLFVACEGNKNKPSGNTYAGDKWLTAPEQFDMSIVDSKTNSCWEWHVWCDGTTIGVEPFWGTEAQLLWLIDQSMKAELKVFGEYHKKYRYYLVEEKTEEACMARQWEGPAGAGWLLSSVPSHRNRASDPHNMLLTRCLTGCPRLL